MNEKIKELAEKAEEFHYETWDSYNQKHVKHYQFNKEKFAELIVRRVISVYNDTETFKTSSYDDKRVLEYFGVEE